MAGNTPDSMLTIRKKELEFFFGLMAENTKENGKTESR